MSAMRRNGGTGRALTLEQTEKRIPCGHCARPVGAVSILGADGTRYHTGCWEAAIVIADRGSALKAAGGTVMGCEPLLDAGGHVRGFRCSRGRKNRPPLCAYCNRPSTKLCDGPAANPGPGLFQKTCDVPMCDQHAHPGGQDVDYCEAHKHLAGNVVRLRGDRG
jgi:hypothetical protein